MCDLELCSSGVCGVVVASLVVLVVAPPILGGIVLSCVLRERSRSLGALAGLALGAALEVWLALYVSRPP